MSAEGAGGTFVDRHGVVVTWMVTSLGMFHAVLHPGNERPRAICGSHVVLTTLDVGLRSGRMFADDDPSASVMTCERCAEMVYRAR